MKVYETGNIRNVVVMGHGGCGKTTLVEAIAYQTGITARMGKVTDGNTISDYDKEEQKRQFSISTSVVPVEFEDIKINFLDTPGYFDFVGEVEEAVSAADAAIIVVSGKAGVQVGTQKAWNLCEKYKLPRMIFVTDMDVDDVSYREVVEELTELYGKRIAPLHFPIREDGKFVGYVNVVKQAGRRYIDKAGKEECPVPDYLTEYLEKYHETLMESVAETSEEFMDRYFEGDTFSVAEVSAAIATNVQDGSIVPVCMGSPVNLRGVSNLLDDICGYFPSPSGRSCNGIAQKTNEIFEANYDFAKAKSAYVFKTIADPFLGKYSLIKVCSGVLKSDDTLLNVEKGTEERVNKLYVLEGSKPIEVPELFAGDIGAIAKLGWPIFVKPANAGSSVGISKVADRAALEKGVEIALREDDKVVFEEFVDAQEVECAAIGNPDDPSTVFTTRPGEILAGAEFYTYDDKYKNGVSQTVIPAHLSEEKLDEVRAEARKAYLALGCSGLSRCDFFVARGTGRVLCNELNTLPGFTSISMYPKLMEHEGYSYPALVDKLLTLAVHRRKGAY